MLDFLFRLPDYLVFLLLIAITIAVSVLFIVINKYLILYKFHYKDNATIASVSSLIGIIFGVLVGFLALYLINNNDHASAAVQREASAVANIYRESKWLKEPSQSHLHTKVKEYINEVIDIEWPLMRTGREIGLVGSNIIDTISSELKNYKITTQSDRIIVGDLVGELNGLYDARQQRIAMSSSQLSPEIWEVILVGTVLIIVINYAFRVSFSLHLFAIVVFAIMAASMLFLLITLDRPFQGEFIVEPDAFQAVQAMIGST